MSDTKDKTTEKSKNISDTAGHRARVYRSIDENPEFAGVPDYEKLEYLLFYIIPRKDTKPLAKTLIRTFGSLSAVLHADKSELMRVDGVGEHSAHFLAHIAPIVLSAEYQRYEHPFKLSTSSDAAKYLHARFLGTSKEMLLMSSLNINDEIIQTNELSLGSVDAVSVNISDIIRIANRNSAKKIILAHNHPGGTLGFSESDISTTRKVIECCNLTGYTFYDHIIFFGNKYLSMFGNDMLRMLTEQSGKYSEVSEALNRKGYDNMLGEPGFEAVTNDLKLKVLDTYTAMLTMSKEKSAELINSLIYEIEE